MDSKYAASYGWEPVIIRRLGGEAVTNEPTFGESEYTVTLETQVAALKAELTRLRAVINIATELDEATCAPIEADSQGRLWSEKAERIADRLFAALREGRVEGEK